VTKNILVWATDMTDTASLTGFTQRFSQTTILNQPFDIVNPTAASQSCAWKRIRMPGSVKFAQRYSTSGLMLNG